MVLTEQVIDLVKRSFGNEELQKIDMDFSEDSETGFSSEIIFVTATGVTKEKKKKVLNLGVKLLKNSLRKLETCVVMFKLEMYVYSTVFPVLKNFLFNKEIKEEPISVPKMYLCFDSQTECVLVMQNLKRSEYILHNKQQHMNVNHLKMVLKEYGQFHGISFALRDQNPKLFDEITKHLIDNKIIKMGMCDTRMIVSLKNNLNTALEILERNGDEILHNKLCQTFFKPANEVMKGILDIEEPQTTICHGDCWNNNFLFKYKDDDQTRPQAVKIIDWQQSLVSSPVLDLANFLYASGSSEEFEKFDELLEFYYESFSTCLKKLGSNPQELFTFSDLKRHWRNYAISGVVFSLNTLKIQLSDEKPQCEDSTAAIFDLPLNDEKSYYARLKAILSHYFSVVD